ncbi:transporter substrate-binding protein [Fictibacillus enclensis]|uniref:transporter substrate-binding protein n=1 Tax=Fictibacillus enclensis TaxID=1017270 RepID=UPI0025A0655C|nr:transporter substrate-binding protein [Fictibacillus enclensis]MDM5336357.1 transporter substrate-binding protein [Fictibacillus enclensis]
MDPIRIGLLFSLTGTTSFTEIGQYRAALYALEQFQNNHRDPSFTFSYDLRDICSDPGESHRHALDLARSGVKVFVGCYTSACRKAVLPILEQYDCILVYPALYEGQEIHPNVFYIGEVPNQQVVSLLQFMVEHFGRRVYLIGNDYIYPRYTNQQIREILSELNGVVIDEQYVPLGHTQFIPCLKNIQLASPSVIFSTLVGESVLHFYQAYYELGLNPKKLPIFSPITTELEIQSMGSMGYKYAAGHYSCSSYFQSLDLPENLQFVQGMKKRYDQDTVISSLMANTYSGIQMILDALIHLQSTDRKKILNYLYKKTFSSPSGKITIESNHHLSREVRIGQANLDGQFNIVWSSKQPIPAKPLMTSTIVDSVNEEPNWKCLVEAVGEETADGVVVLGKDRTILYANPTAQSILQSKHGDVLKEDPLQKISSTHHLIEKDIYKYEFLLLFIKKTERLPLLEIKPDQEEYRFGRVVTYNPTFKKELRASKIASQSDASVLILGETGSGKEVLARTIHEQSPRCSGPFVVLNAGAIQKELIASELFGYVEGAFTGARKGGSPGKFEVANGGTFFLDEIGEMPLELQVSLLRVLEERKIVRIGDHKERPINVRVIAATNRNLKEEIAYEGSFRSDLFYRLNVFTIHLPPLCQRIEDIETLTMQFLKQFQQHYCKGPSNLCNSSLQMLQSYNWPGNIRELRNAIERAFLLANDEPKILPHHLPAELQKDDNANLSSSVNLKNMEKQLIEQALRESTSVTEAAKKLGITRSTLYRKINH